MQERMLKVNLYCCRFHSWFGRCKESKNRQWRQNPVRLINCLKKNDIQTYLKVFHYWFWLCSVSLCVCHTVGNTRANSPHALQNSWSTSYTQVISNHVFASEYNWSHLSLLSWAVVSEQSRTPLFSGARLSLTSRNVDLRGRACRKKLEIKTWILAQDAASDLYFPYPYLKLKVRAVWLLGAFVGFCSRAGRSLGGDWLLQAIHDKP